MLDLNNSSVNISMNAKSYEDIINNVLYKAPLEIGVEIAVYMLLYGIIDKEKYAVMDVNSMKKKKFIVYANAGEDISKVPDLVIVNNVFKYNHGEHSDSNNDGAYGIIEVKGLAIEYSEKEYEAQKGKANHFIWTNGISWFFDGSDESIVLAKKSNSGKYCIKEDKFKELLERIYKIDWETE